MSFNFVSSEACSTVDMSSKNNLLVSKIKKGNKFRAGRFKCAPNRPEEYDKVPGHLRRSLFKSGSAYFALKIDFFQTLPLIFFLV